MKKINNYIQFISNNVKGLQSLEMRIKVFEYWKIAYNANKECEQLNVLITLWNFLSDITDLHCKNVIFGGDFNVFFNTNYESQGGNPALKKRQ